MADDGPGIPPDVLDRVFDLYFTTRLDGTGVGLALVRQAAEMHGGEVAIDSTPDTGTVVTIEMPWRRTHGTRGTTVTRSPSRHRGRRGGFLLAGWLVLTGLAGGGCAHFPPWRKAKPTAPVIVPGKPAPEEPAGTDPRGDQPAARGPAEEEKGPASSAKPPLHSPAGRHTAFATGPATTRFDAVPHDPLRGHPSG